MADVALSIRAGPVLTDDDVALAVIGSRTQTGPAAAERLERAIDAVARLHARPTAIVSGGAAGVDALAAAHARRAGLSLVIHRPLDPSNKGDYLRRNGEIVREAHIVLALPDADAKRARGTWDGIRRALALGRTTYVAAERPPTDHARRVADGLYEMHYNATA